MSSLVIATGPPGSNSSSPTNFEVVVANGRQFVPIMAAPVHPTPIASFVAHPAPTLAAIRPVATLVAANGQANGPGKEEVFRSMKVGNSKTPYSDATQVSAHHS